MLLFTSSKRNLAVVQEASSELEQVGDDPSVFLQQMATGCLLCGRHCANDKESNSDIIMHCLDARQQYSFVSKNLAE